MTDLQIVNRALALIGSIQATAMADTARNAVRAVTAYPRCRDEMQRMIPWPCITKRIAMPNSNHMACSWLTTTRYEVGDRAYNPGTNLTYVCTIAGTSAAVPVGTGTGIVDGTCTWDYVEASTALNNWRHWPATIYALDDIVAWAHATSGGRRIYGCITAGTTAAATPPTTTAEDITDGTVHWCYYGLLPHNATVYAYQYVVPFDCLRVLKVPSLVAATESQQGEQYTREGNWLYTDQDDSVVRYIRRDLEPSNWTPDLQETIVLRIADEICFELTGQKDLAQLINQKWIMQYGISRQIALNEGAEAAPEDILWVDA